MDDFTTQMSYNGLDAHRVHVKNHHVDSVFTTNDI